MRFLVASLAVIGSVLISGSEALTASSISGCPKLAARAKAATSVADLRPDDIKVVGALGDSIMAGFAAAGITGSSIIDISSIFEYRGISYGAGGDSGAVTIPNFFKKYNPSLKGASVGKHLAEICYGPLCFPLQYRPLLDVLNAAQSAAMAPNIDHELDYLITTMKLYPGLNYKNDWKLINVQIGSNDQCASCINSVIPYLTVESYGQHLSAAVERIRNEIPRVIVNLIGVFNVSQVYTVTSSQEYCQPFMNSDFQINTFECPCALDTQYRKTMDDMAAGYTQQLANIAQNYQSAQNDSFAVIYTPANIKVSSFPLEGFSNVDCFHPSKLGHEYVAKSLWNTLFMPLANKPDLFTWDSNLQVYCPTEADRIQID